MKPSSMQLNFDHTDIHKLQMRKEKKTASHWNSGSDSTYAISSHS